MQSGVDLCGTNVRLFLYSVRYSMRIVTLNIWRVSLEHHPVSSAQCRTASLYLPDVEIRLVQGMFMVVRTGENQISNRNGISINIA